LAERYRGIVERLVDEGASVVTCARHATESLLPDGASFIEANITDEDSVAGVIDAAVNRHGHLDVVVANAGGANIGPWPDEPFDQWRELIDINLHGTMLTCRAARPHLVSAQGNIVVVSSLSAWMGVGAHEMERMGGFQPSAAYQASKAGIEGLAKHLAGRGGEHARRVNVVRPGRISLTSGKSCSAGTASSGRTTRNIQLLKRHGRAEDIAAVLDVDGGAVAKL
jgi:NAD(P)-dependent dehydrogenase (short-subunit alcohol dehydrogenase family)